MEATTQTSPASATPDPEIRPKATRCHHQWYKGSGHCLVIRERAVAGAADAANRASRGRTSVF